METDDKKTKTKKVSKSTNKKTKVRKVIKNEEKQLEKKENVTKTTKKKDKKFDFYEVILFIILSVVVGLIIGFLISNMKEKSKDYSNSVNNAIEDVRKMSFYNPSNSDMNYNAIYGMLNGIGDPYATYMTEDVGKSYLNDINGYFVGIGVEITSYSSGFPIVTKVYENGPSEKAGIVVGDYISKVNGKSTENLSSYETSALILNNEKGKKVDLTILRGEEEINFAIKRDNVIVPTVFYDMKVVNGKNVATITVSNITAKTYDQFKDKCDKAMSDGAEFFVIDMRNNFGENYNDAAKMASLFIERDKVIYKRVLKDGVFEVRNTSKKRYDIPVIVVQNICTSGASEMFTSSLLINSNATIVGTKTAGKDSVLDTFRLSDGTYITITTEKWVDANGTVYDGSGIEPTYFVEQPEDCSVATDNQLEYAYSLIK